MSARPTPATRPESTASDTPCALTPTNHTGEIEILALRGSQWAANATPSPSTPTPSPQTPATGNAPTVRLRLHGTRAEIATTLAALAEVLDIRTVSLRYPDRPPSRLCRVYIDAAPRPDRPSA